jgi:hypothetical protein
MCSQEQAPVLKLEVLELAGLEKLAKGRQSPPG